MKVINAEIRSTHLGPEGHGIMTAYLNMRWEGGGQSFGGYALRGGENDYGILFIERVLKTVGVNKWEELPGNHVRIEHTHTKISRIGHLIKDKWFSPDDLRNEVETGVTK